MTTARTWGQPALSPPTAYVELRINFHAVTITDPTGTREWKFKRLKWIKWKNAHETYLGCGYTTTEIVRDSRGRLNGYVMHKPYVELEQAA